MPRGNAPKGDVLGVARTAGILAAKRTPDLIPLCHPLRITGVDVAFALDAAPLRRSRCEARVRTVDKTGVEMEALTAGRGRRPHRVRHGQGRGEGVTITDLALVEKIRRQVGSLEARARRLK